jgi:hypothetical protein
VKDLRLMAGLASMMAGAASMDAAMKQANSETWRGLGGQRSCLKVRHQSPPPYKQGARECARRRKQMGFADDRASKQ